MYIYIHIYKYASLRAASRGLRGYVSVCAQAHAGFFQVCQWGQLVSCERPLVSFSKSIYWIKSAVQPTLANRG